MHRRTLLTTAGLAGIVSLGLVGANSPAQAIQPRLRKPLRWTTRRTLLTDPSLPEATIDALDSTPAGTWGVGAILVDGFQETRPLAVHWNGKEFAQTPINVDHSAQLHSVAIASTSEVWAVGEESPTDGETLPLVMRWNGRRWGQIAAPKVPAGTFGDVVIAPDGSVWATGWARVGDAEPAVVYRWHRGRWTLFGDGLEDAINGNALLVHSTKDAWLALNPGLAHFDGTSWTVVKEVPADGSAIISGFAANGRKDIWAAGVSHTSDGERPLILHHDGTKWSTVQTLQRYGQLYDVTTWRGRVIAVGERLTEDDDMIISHPWVLERRDDRFVSVPAPTASNATLTTVIGGKDRVWTAGLADWRPLVATAS